MDVIAFIIIKKKKSPPKHYWKNKCKKLCQPNLTQNSSSMFFVFRGLNLLFIKFYPLRETKTQTIFFPAIVFVLIATVLFPTNFHCKKSTLSVILGAKLAFVESPGNILTTHNAASMGKWTLSSKWLTEKWTFGTRPVRKLGTIFVKRKLLPTALLMGDKHSCGYYNSHSRKGFPNKVKSYRREDWGKREAWGITFGFYLS